MDQQNREGEICLNGGVTLRTLLQSRDLLSLPAPVKVAADKEDIDSCDVQSDATAAFLGPNIWDKTLSDFKLEYFDIDDILEKIVPAEGGAKVVETDETIKPETAPQLLQLTSAKESKNIHVTVVPDHLRTQVPLPPQQKIGCKSPRSSPSPEEQPNPCKSEGKKMKYTIELPFSPTELALATAPGHDHFDPTKSVLPEEDLKPQPMVKKSRKNFVPEDLKDDKYWARRRKNNIAAKRSREARRVKENQIVLRASFLEKENSTLKEDVLRLKAENEMLRNQLKKYKQ